MAQSKLRDRAEALAKRTLLGFHGSGASAGPSPAAAAAAASAAAAGGGAAAAGGGRGGIQVRRRASRGPRGPSGAGGARARLAGAV